MNQSDNEGYWVKRHETLRGSLSSVGGIGTPEQENRQRYALKKRKVASLLRYFRKLDLHGSTVLDVGCGIGVVSELFFSLGADVSGVDASPIAIAEARDRAGPPPRSPDNFKIGSIVSFNFEKQFDFTFCLDVLYHVVDDLNWETALKNLVKHTKTGGYLVLSDKTKPGPQRPAEHVRFRTKAMYDDVLNGLGLRDFAPGAYGDLMVYRLRRRSLSGLGLPLAAYVSKLFRRHAPKTVSTPTFSPLPGSYATQSGTFVLTVSVIGPAWIYVTTDGSTPRSKWDPRSGMHGTEIQSNRCIVVLPPGTTTLKAMGVAPGKTDSAIATGVYAVSVSGSGGGGEPRRPSTVATPLVAPTSGA